MKDLYQISYERGMTCLRTNNYVEALEHFSESIRLRPFDPEPLVQRGFAYRMSGDIALAKNDFTASIILRFKNPEAFLQRGFAHLSSQNFPLAIKNIRYSMMQKPNNPEAYLPLGYAYLKSRCYEQAIKYISRSLERDPQNSYAIEILTIAITCRDDSLKPKPVAVSTVQAVLPARLSENKPLPAESTALASTSLAAQPQQAQGVVIVPQIAAPSFEARTQCTRSTVDQESQALS